MCIDRGQSAYTYVCQRAFLMARYFTLALFCVEVYWQGSGPLFFYTGNEGAIEEFYTATGFLFTLAQQFKAMIIFAEHVSQRYLLRTHGSDWWNLRIVDMSSFVVGLSLVLRSQTLSLYFPPGRERIWHTCIGSFVLSAIRSRVQLKS